MGALAPGSAHARPSAQAPIDTSGNFYQYLFAVYLCNYLCISIGMTISVKPYQRIHLQNFMEGGVPEILSLFEILIFGIAEPMQRRSPKRILIPLSYSRVI